MCLAGLSKVWSTHEAYPTFSSSKLARSATSVFTCAGGPPPPTTPPPLPPPPPPLVSCLQINSHPLYITPGLCVPFNHMWPVAGGLPVALSIPLVLACWYRIQIISATGALGPLLGWALAWPPPPCPALHWSSLRRWGLPCFLVSVRCLVTTSLLTQFIFHH